MIPVKVRGKVRGPLYRTCSLGYDSRLGYCDHIILAASIQSGLGACPRAN